MRRLFVLAFASAFVALPAAASAHTTEKYWICKANGTRSHGTTKRHVHHKQPSARHMRRHRCTPRTRTLGAHHPAPAPAPQPVVNVYVTNPCGTCPPEPPESCGDNCSDGDSSHGSKKHKNKGHGKGC